MIFGSNGAKLQVQSIHGTQRETWFGGVGIAVDDCFLQLFPVFIDLRMHIFKNSNGRFIYGEGAVNVVGKDVDHNVCRIDHKKEVFYEGGIGYKIGIDRQMGLVVTAGYSSESCREERNKKNI